MPPEIQQRILEVCKNHLTENGVAYISFNAYPGWFMRGMIREMMLYHTRGFEEPAEKVRQSRGLLQFLVESTEGQTSPYAQFLKQELDTLSKQSDSYLFHEHLEPNNRPMFYHQFIERLHNNGLQYLSDSSLASMMLSNLPSKAAETLRSLTKDFHQQNQYTDFVTNRMFRQSLVVHGNLMPNRHIDQSSLVGMYFSAKLTKSVEVADGVTEYVFSFSNGRVLRMKHPATCALFDILLEAWPASLSIDEIRSQLKDRNAELPEALRLPEQQIPSLIYSQIIQLLVRGDVQFRYLKDRFETSIGERPRVTSLARLQASKGQALTNLKHSLVFVDPITRMFVEKLDGSLSVDEISDWFGDKISKDKLVLRIGGEDVSNDPEGHKQSVLKIIGHLQDLALLES